MQMLDVRTTSLGIVHKWRGYGWNAAIKEDGPKPNDSINMCVKMQEEYAICFETFQPM